MEDVALLALRSADDPEEPKQSDHSDDEGEDPFSHRKPSPEGGVPGEAPVVEEVPDDDELKRTRSTQGYPTKKDPRRGTSKRDRLRDDLDSEDSDDDRQPIHFFVPGENIKHEVLVDYMNKYLDRTARITSAKHPTVSEATIFVFSKFC